MTYSFIPPESLDALAKKFGIGPYAQKITSPQKGSSSKKSSEFIVDELEDRFTLDGVLYKGLEHEIEIITDLLDKGQPRTQDNWTKFLAKKKIIIPSSQLYFSILNTLFDNKDGNSKKLVAKIRQMLKNDFKNNWMMTSSRVCYNAGGTDVVKHNYGTKEEYESQTDITGPDGYLASTDFEEPIEALLETKDLDKVKEVIKWASGYKPYMWRLNEKPAQDTERAVVLGVVDDGRFFIDCVDVIGSNWPARGVVVGAPKNSTGKAK